MTLAEDLLRKLLGTHVEYQRALPGYDSQERHSDPYPASLRGSDPHENLELTDEEDAYVRNLMGISDGA